MWNKYFFGIKVLITSLFYYDILSNNIMLSCDAEKIRYISTEHPNVTFAHPKYLSYFNITSKRYGRRNILYFVDVHFISVWPIANNVSLDFYFYEFLTNEYKRSFVEMHFEMCDMIHNDRFFGAPMRQGLLSKPCPYPPGEYHLYNMSIDIRVIPRNFPFRKGRIYLKISSTETKFVMGRGYIDMEIKEINVKKFNKG